jgi:hypothetical protein
MLHAEYFQKTLCDRRNRHFFLFWGGFVWGLYGGGLTGKCKSFVRDLSFWLARRTPQQFSPIAHNQLHNPDHLLCAFWTAGFTARPPDIGSVCVWCNTIFQASNRTIRCILKRSARFYGDCMEPNHLVKYSLPVLTDLSKNLIKINQLFHVLTPLQFWGCFWTRLGILRSPVCFLSGKLEYWRNIRGGKFCSVLSEATIEDLNLNPPVSVLLIFASVPDCSQNQTALSDTLRLLSDF